MSVVSSFPGGAAEKALTHLQASPADSPCGPFGSVFLRHRSPSKKGPSYVFIQDLVDVFTIISRIFQVSNFSDPIWGGFFLHITYRQYEPVNDLPMKEPPKKKNLSNKHGKNRGIDKMKLVSKRGSSTCSL